MVSSENQPPQMTSATVAFNTFLRTWRQALSNRETGKRRFWEGQKAYSDLKKAGYLERVRLEEQGDEDGAYGSGLGHFIPEHALPKICRILNAYKRDLRRVRTLIDSQQDVEDFLDQEAHKFRKKSERLSARGHKGLALDLLDLAEKVDEGKRSTRLRLRDHFRNQLGFVLPFKDHRILQERELDTRFQVQLGVILRTFMQGDPFAKCKRNDGPPLRTIARLTVLFLVCADLAYVKDDKARLRHNDRPVTVEGVLQQLRGAQVDSQRRKQ
jgi:hypothetical protein